MWSKSIGTEQPQQLAQNCFQKATGCLQRKGEIYSTLLLRVDRSGTVQKVQGGWAGAFRNVVVRKHITHPFQLEKNGVTHP